MNLDEKTRRLLNHLAVIDIPNVWNPDARRFESAYTVEAAVDAGGFKLIVRANQSVEWFIDNTERKFEAISYSHTKQEIADQLVETLTNDKDEAMTQDEIDAVALWMGGQITDAQAQNWVDERMNAEACVTGEECGVDHMYDMMAESDHDLLEAIGLGDRLGDLEEVDFVDEQ